MEEFLKVYEFEKKVRLGQPGDGGYVIADLQDNEYDCYISAGVADEESFTREFLSYNSIDNTSLNKGNCFAFDGTIQNYPEKYSKEIQFFRKNIGIENSDNTTNLEDILRKYYKIFLKMDIEGWEYPWLTNIDHVLLKNIKQVTMEFHGINDDSWGSARSIKIECLRRLSKSHYLIHAHGNNYSGVTNGIPDVIELTYVNKNCFEKVPNLNKAELPSKLDHPNYSQKQDYNLNFYPFVNV